MNVRQLREADHGPVVAVVDGWWGGRRVADKLPRLFFRYFAGTSFAVEEDGEIVAFLVGFVGSPADEAYVHFVGVRPDRRSRGLGRQLYGMFFDEARRRGCRSVRGLLYIDFFFRLPLEVAGVALALSFISLMRNRPAEAPADEGIAASPPDSPALAK